MVVFLRKLLATPSGGADFAKRRLSETDNDHPRPSKRELAVLTAMADGLSNKEIARRLEISFHTVCLTTAA